MNNYSVIKLMYSDNNGNEILRLYRSMSEAKEAIKALRKTGLYHSYRMKMVRYK